VSSSDRLRVIGKPARRRSRSGALKDLGLAETLMDGRLLATTFGSGLEALLFAGDTLTPYARAVAERAKDVDARADTEYLTTMQEMYFDLRLLVFNTGCRALLVPTLRTTFVAADNDPGTDTYRLNGQDLPGRGWFATTPFNILNHCPVVNVPTGLAEGTECRPVCRSSPTPTRTSMPSRSPRHMLGLLPDSAAQTWSRITVTSRDAAYAALVPGPRDSASSPASSK
jgi:hypothetical protein